MNKLSNFFIAQESNNYRPPVLSYKAFLIYGLLMLILRLLLGTVPAHGAAVESRTLMELINSERSSRNLGTLITHSSLVTAASQKSQDMIDRDYFAHVDPDGNYIWPKIMAAGYGQYKILGENLAVDFLTSEGMVKAWLDSPTHRDNLLHTDFHDQGLVALYGDFQGRYTNLTASLFGTRLLGTATPPKPSPQPPPPTVESEQEPPPPTPTQPLPPPAPAAKPPTPPAAAPTPTQPLPPPEAPPNPGPDDDSGWRTASAEPLNFPKIAVNSQAVSTSRVIFTLFGLVILAILMIDSIIILRHEAAIYRSHSSNHLFGLMILVWISILIWWW